MRRAVLAILFAMPAALWAGWESETVATEGNVGEGCALGVDRWGRLHISYVDKTNGEVKYARYAGSSWEFETIASDVDVRGLTAIDLDAFDQPHVVFSDEKAGELTHAYRSATTWVTEKITDGTDNLYVSIYAWGSGPHVTYAKVATMTSLRYAYRDDGGWHTESIGSGGEFNKIFLDNDGAPHVVFWNSSGSKVKHGVRKEGEWTVGDVAEGVYCDGAVGPDGKIYVSFASEDNEKLNYGVSSTGESWDIEEIKVAQGKPAVTQIVLNGDGDLFVSYYSVEEFDLHSATKTGGSWEHSLVATGGDVGDPQSIAVGDDGYPVIAYYGSIEENLMLARYDPLTDVELTSFTAKRARGSVDIRWAVNAGSTAAGYNLYRSAADGEREKINAALVEGVSPFRYRDKAASAGVAYRYWLEVVATAGKTRTFGPASVPPAAEARTFALYQNAPNPFAGATTFTFELPEASDVKLAIYDVAGRKVAGVTEGRFAAGRHEMPFANELAPGVYIYRLEAGPNAAARKMVVIN